MVMGEEDIEFLNDDNGSTIMVWQTFSQVPEPSGIVLMLTGACSLGVYVCRRRRRK